jgi:hypothetical protein
LCSEQGTLNTALSLPLPHHNHVSWSPIPGPQELMYDSLQISITCSLYSIRNSSCFELTGRSDVTASLHEAWQVNT